MADAYWTPGPGDEPVEIHPDPTDHLIEEERELATNHFVNADLTEAQREAARILTNGGPQRVDRVAEEADISQSTVYRLVQRLDSIVDLLDGRVTFADDIIRNRVKQLFGILDRDFEYVVNETRKLVRRTTGEVLEGTVFEDWLHAYGAEVLDNEEWVIRLRLGELSDYEVWRAVKEGLRAAGAVVSRTRARFEDATIRWTTPAGETREAPLVSGSGSHVRFLGGELDGRQAARQARAIAAR